MTKMYIETNYFNPSEKFETIQVKSITLNNSDTGENTPFYTLNNDQISESLQYIIDEKIDLNEIIVSYKTEGIDDAFTISL